MEGSNDFISPSRHTRTHTHTDTHTRKSNSIVLNRKLKKIETWSMQIAPNLIHRRSLNIFFLSWR